MIKIDHQHITTTCDSCNYTKPVKAVTIGKYDNLFYICNECIAELIRKLNEVS